MAFQSVFSNKNELLELSALSLAAILLPIVFSHQSMQNQFLVGTAVNFILFLAATRFSLPKLLPLAIAPSVGAYLSAIVFGAQTQFLLFFLPAIWLANMLFMFCIKNNRDLIFSAFAKAVLLFSTALLLVFLNAVPSSFLIAMGPLQLATALTGGFIGSRLR